MDDSNQEDERVAARKKLFAEAEREFQRKKQEREKAEDEEQRRQQTVRGKDGWDFSQLGYRNEEEKKEESEEERRARRNARTAGDIGVIFNATVDATRNAALLLKAEAVREKMGKFVEQHETAVREFASSLTGKKYVDTHWHKSRMNNREDFRKRFDSYNDALNRALKDFRTMADKSNPRLAAEVFNTWTKDNTLSAQLEEMLRLADEPSYDKNKDLNILDNPELTAKIRIVYQAALPIIEVLQEITRQKAEQQVAAIA